MMREKRKEINNQMETKNFIKSALHILVTTEYLKMTMMGMRGFMIAVQQTRSNIYNILHVLTLERENS